MGVLTMIFLGCSDINFTMDGYKRAVRSGLNKIPEAQQFDEIFGKENVDQFISYSGNRNDCTWNSDVYIRGRYRLKMYVIVKMGRSFDEVLEVIGEPKFHVIEIRKINYYDNGQIGASMAPDFEGKYGRFGQEEWKKIYEAGGDFSVVGIPLKGEEVPPVPDFEKYVAQIRRDRVQVER